MPQVSAPPFALWQSDKDTAWLFVPVTVMMNWNCSPVPRLALEGVIFTRTPESTITVNVPNTVGFTQLVATTRKLSGCGGPGGAV